MKSGLSPQHFKESIRPQDDLFRFANGSWLDSTSSRRPRLVGSPSNFESYPRSGSKRSLMISSTNPAPHGSNGQKIADLYTSFMNEAAIEAAGIDPIREDLAKASAITDLQSFISFMADLENRGTGGFFYSYISGDVKDVETNIAYIGQGGIGLPDEAYYTDSEFAEIRVAYVDHIQKMLEIAGISDASSHAARVMELETEIASHHWDQVKDRDADLTYNKYSYSELKKLAPAFDWDLYLSAGKVPAKVFETVVVGEPSFFEGISAMFTHFDLEKWRSWLIWNIIHGSAPYLHTPLVQENFNFYAHTLSGVPEMRARWKRAISLTRRWARRSDW
jgi:putative endopeptidase